MRVTPRALRFVLEFAVLGVGTCLLASPPWVRLLAHPSTSSGWPERAEGQDQAPNRREFTITARDYRFSPNRLEVNQDDLIKVTVQSADVDYSLTIDAYRVSRRVPAGGSTTLEFRADQSGTFAFYSNLTSDSRHAQTRGDLIVRPR